MKASHWIVGGLSLCGVLVPPVAGASGAEAFRSAVENTKPLANVRLRAEEVDQAGMSEDASALTLRGRLGFQTGKAWNTSLIAEGEYVWPLVSDYNSTLNGRTQYPTVSDPETREINRLMLTNTSIKDTTLVFGRQNFFFDDSRFVADTTWRQNEQTYDAFLFVNKSIPKVTVSLAYLDQVNRNVGRESSLGRYEGDNYLANVGVQTPVGKLALFDYLTEFEQAPRDSSQTVGVRFAGERPLGKVKVGYIASYANQSERANNPLDFSLSYRNYEMSGSVREYTLRGGVEVFEGNGVKGFSTPLGAAHTFQGWADKFTNVPAAGLENRYVALAYAKKAFGLFDSVGATAKYHSFKSDLTDADLGSEINLQLQAKWHRFSGMVKYADYSADSTATTDTSKLWVQVEYVL